MQTHGKQDNKYVGLIYCDCGANMVRRYYYSERMVFCITITISFVVLARISRKI